MFKTSAWSPRRAALVGLAASVAVGCIVGGAHVWTGGNGDAVLKREIAAQGDQSCESPTSLLTPIVLHWPDGTPIFLPAHETVDIVVPSSSPALPAKTPPSTPSHLADDSMLPQEYLATGHPLHSEQKHHHTSRQPVIKSNRPSVDNFRQRFRGLVTKPMLGWHAVFGILKASPSAGAPSAPHTPFESTSSGAAARWVGLEVEDAVAKALARETRRLREKWEKRVLRGVLRRRKRRMWELKEVQDAESRARAEENWRYYLAHRNGITDLVVYRPPAYGLPFPTASVFWEEMVCSAQLLLGALRMCVCMFTYLKRRRQADSSGSPSPGFPGDDDSPAPPDLSSPTAPPTPQSALPIKIDLNKPLPPLPPLPPVPLVVVESIVKSTSSSHPEAEAKVATKPRAAAPTPPVRPESPDHATGPPVRKVQAVKPTEIRAVTVPTPVRDTPVSSASPTSSRSENEQGFKVVKNRRQHRQEVKSLDKTQAPPPRQNVTSASKNWRPVPATKPIFDNTTRRSPTLVAAPARSSPPGPVKSGKIDPERSFSHTTLNVPPGITFHKTETSASGTATEYRASVWPELQEAVRSRPTRVEGVRKEKSVDKRDVVPEDPSPQTITALDEVKDEVMEDVIDEVPDEVLREVSEEVSDEEVLEIDRSNEGQAAGEGGIAIFPGDLLTALMRSMGTTIAEPIRLAFQVPVTPSPLESIRFFTIATVFPAPSAFRTTGGRIFASMLRPRPSLLDPLQREDVDNRQILPLFDLFLRLNLKQKEIRVTEGDIPEDKSRALVVPSAQAQHVSPTQAGPTMPVSTDPEAEFKRSLADAQDSATEDAQREPGRDEASPRRIRRSDRRSQASGKKRQGQRIRSRKRALLHALDAERPPLRRSTSVHNIGALLSPSEPLRRRTSFSGWPSPPVIAAPAQSSRTIRPLETVASVASDRATSPVVQMFGHVEGVPIASSPAPPMATSNSTATVQRAQSSTATSNSSTPNLSNNDSANVERRYKGKGKSSTVNPDRAAASIPAPIGSGKLFDQALLAITSATPSGNGSHANGCSPKSQSSQASGSGTGRSKK